MSTFHLIAPSGYCIKQHAALRGIERLKNAGHQVNNVAVIERRSQRFAGTETERLGDLNALVNLHAPDTIVMAVRGGYGASRLLPDINWQALIDRQQQNSLLICGHSDFTAIQCGLLALGNVITFSGPMLVANFGADEMNAFTEYHFWQALRSPTFTLEWQGDGPACQTAGTLWGGNLAMLVSLIGTPWMPQIDGGVLVVEDINEHPFRVERMLLQLYHAGILQRQNAIILGSFSGSKANDYDEGYSLDSVCDFLRQRLTIPLIAGLDFGHEQRTVTLPLGANAILENGANGTRLTISGHPVLKM